MTMKKKLWVALALLAGIPGLAWAGTGLMQGCGCPFCG